MTTQEFINQWNGKLLDFDKAYGAQCKDVFSQYNRDVVGNPTYIVGNAHELFDRAPDSVYEKIKNTPTGVPQAGDIIIWDQGIGQYGHVAIFIEGNTNRFTSFDQNFPVGSPCHIQEHSYKAVKGWLRPRSFHKPAPEDARDVRIRELEARIRELESRPPQTIEKIVEKIVEKPVEVIKQVEITKEVPVEVPLTIESVATAELMHELIRRLLRK